MSRKTEEIVTEISNKIKYFYAERIVDKSCNQITEDFWQQMLC